MFSQSRVTNVEVSCKIPNHETEAPIGADCRGQDVESDDLSLLGSSWSRK